MSRKQLRDSLPVLMLGVATLASAHAAAQDSDRGPWAYDGSGPIKPHPLTVKQISVALPSEPTARAALLASLQRAADGVVSCDEVDDVAKRLNGKVITADIDMRDLPPVLQDQMKNRVIGRSSQIYGMAEKAARILVRCS